MTRESSSGWIPQISWDQGQNAQTFIHIPFIWIHIIPFQLCIYSALDFFNVAHFWLLKYVILVSCSTHSAYCVQQSCTSSISCTCTFVTRFCVHLPSPSKTEFLSAMCCFWVYQGHGICIGEMLGWKFGVTQMKNYAHGQWQTEKIPCSNFVYDEIGTNPSH